MAIFALAVAFVLGLLRWPVWTALLLMIAGIMLSLGVGAGWNADSFRPFNNPIFIDLVLKLLLIYAIACSIGYGAGRLIAFAWRRVRRG